MAHYSNEENEKQFCLSLDLIDEVRMDAKQRVAHYKYLMTKDHDALVKPRKFNIGDLILKRVSLGLLRTPLMENWDLIGNDHRELSIPKGEVHTTWRLWMDESWSTRGM